MDKHFDTLALSCCPCCLDRIRLGLVMGRIPVAAFPQNAPLAVPGNYVNVWLCHTVLIPPLLLYHVNPRIRSLTYFVAHSLGLAEEDEQSSEKICMGCGQVLGENVLLQEPYPCGVS
jgi:hypothetical protein